MMNMKISNILKAYDFKKKSKIDRKAWIEKRKDIKNGFDYKSK